MCPSHQYVLLASNVLWLKVLQCEDSLRTIRSNLEVAGQQTVELINQVLASALHHHG